MEQIKLRRQIKKNNFIFLITSLILLNSCSSNLSQKKLTSQLGVNAKLEKNIYYWSTGDDLQGEGFEICLNNLKITDSVLININYPIADLDKEGWLISTWKSTPVDLDNFDLIFDYNIKNEAVKKNILEIEKSLKDKNNYYSYYYNYAKNTDVVIGIDLYVINLKKKIIYKCEVKI